MAGRSPSIHGSTSGADGLREPADRDQWVLRVPLVHDGGDDRDAPGDQRQQDDDVGGA
jgi:hypothetical protein